MDIACWDTHTYIYYYYLFRLSSVVVVDNIAYAMEGEKEDH